MSIKTAIEWCDATVNPIIGCKHDCPYCFARRMNDTRFHWVEDFAKPQRTKGFMTAIHRREPTTFFVGDLCDLFGDWVSDDLIQEVFRECEKRPQHRYLFLTKNPKRYTQDPIYHMASLWEHDSWWFGTTITSFADAKRIMQLPLYRHCFLSIEPIHSGIEFGTTLQTSPVKWVILGAESGDREGKVTPKREWIENIVAQCDKLKYYGGKPQIAVFMKDSLIPIVGEENMRREFPWEGATAK